MIAMAWRSMMADWQRRGEGRPGIDPVDQFSPERAEPRVVGTVAARGELPLGDCRAVTCRQWTARVSDVAVSIAKWTLRPLSSKLRFDCREMIGGGPARHACGSATLLRPETLFRCCLLPGRALRSNVPRGHEQVERVIGTAIRDLHSQGLLPAAQGAEVEDGPVQPRQPEQAGHHASGLSQGKLEEHLDRKTELDGGIGEDRRAPGKTFMRRQPGHLSIHPDQQRAAFAQHGIVGRPVRRTVAGACRLAHAARLTAWIYHVNRPKSEFCNNAMRQTQAGFRPFCGGRGFIPRR